MFLYPNLSSVASIIVGLACIAIAVSWPRRNVRYIFIAFVTAMLIFPSVSHLAMSLCIQAGFNYRSIAWIHYTNWFSWLLSLILLALFAMTARTAFDEPPNEVIQVNEDVGPRWNTDLDSRQLKLVSTKRNFAFLIDSLPMILAFITAVYAMGIEGMQRKGDPMGAEVVIITGFVFFAIVGPIYLLLKDSIRGQSIGKSFFDCRVVMQSTGQPAGISESTLRNLMFVIPFGAFAELVVTMLRPDGRRLGDEIARTTVVFGPPDFIDGLVVASEVIEERHPLDD